MKNEKDLVLEDFWWKISGVLNFLISWMLLNLYLSCPSVLLAVAISALAAPTLLMMTKSGYHFLVRVIKGPESVHHLGDVEVPYRFPGLFIFEILFYPLGCLKLKSQKLAKCTEEESFRHLTK